MYAKYKTLWHLENAMRMIRNEQDVAERESDPMRYTALDKVYMEVTRAKESFEGEANEKGLGG